MRLHAAPSPSRPDRLSTGHSRLRAPTPTGGRPPLPTPAWRGAAAVALAALVGLAGARAPGADDGFVPLFNGRNLDGWVNVNCAPGTWTATNGLVFCSGAPIGELRTRRMYQNFILELEWRHLEPKGNAGVFVWADALTARGQPFIRGIEVQVLDGREGPGHTSDGDIFPIHGARMTPVNGRGGDRAFPTEKRMKPSPEWNHYRIECRDGSIALSVNGAVVTRGHSASPRKGYICLESEGSPVEFRNLRLLELPASTTLAPADIAQPDDHHRPLYSGLDLDGWEAPAPDTTTWKPSDWTLDGAPDAKFRPLVSTRDFGDGEFVFDWRWTDAGRRGDWTSLIQLRGTDLAPVLKTLSAPGGAGLERPVGEWNRAVFRIRGNELAVQVNGQSPDGSRITLAPEVPPTGRIRLQPPSAPAQVANLFWKALD